MTEPSSSSRRQVVLESLADLVTDFLYYYDRDAEEHHLRAEIAAAIASGEVTVEELVAVFRAGLDGKR